MYFPELEQFANENPKWQDWIATLDQVFEKNIGRVVSVEELREFVPASEKQLDEIFDVLCDAKRKRPRQPVRRANRTPRPSMLQPERKRTF